MDAVNSPPPAVPTAALILGGFVVFAGTGALIFIFRHWEHARRPLAMMGFGVVLILAIVALPFAK